MEVDIQKGVLKIGEIFDNRCMSLSEPLVICGCIAGLLIMTMGYMIYIRLECYSSLKQISYVL